MSEADRRKLTFFALKTLLRAGDCHVYFREDGEYLGQVESVNPTQVVVYGLDTVEGLQSEKYDLDNIAVGPPPAPLAVAKGDVARCKSCQFFCEQILPDDDAFPELGVCSLIHGTHVRVGRDIKPRSRSRVSGTSLSRMPAPMTSQLARMSLTDNWVGSDFLVHETFGCVHHIPKEVEVPS